VALDGEICRPGDDAVWDVRLQARQAA
jgi:hypothetical protein